MYWLFIRLIYIETYNNLMMSTINSINNLAFLFGTISLIYNIWPDISRFLYPAGIIFFGPMIVFLSIFSRSKIYSNNIFKDSENENSVIEKCLMQCKLLDEIKHSDNSRHFLLRALIANHLHYCKDELCPITYVNSNFYIKKNRNIDDSISMISFYIKKCFIKNIKKFPKSINLKLLYADYLIEYTESFIEAWSMIISIDNTEINFIENFKAFLLYEKMKKKSLEHFNNLNTINLLLQQRSENMFLYEIEENANLYIKLWNILNEQRPNYCLLENTGLKMIKRSEKLEKIWAIVKNKDYLSVNTLWLYALYCYKILTDVKKAEEINELIQGTKVVNTHTKLAYSSDSPLITVSGVQNDLGIIKKYNAAFCSVTGYAKNELIDRPITKIIPSIYLEVHNKGISNASIKIESGHKLNAMEYSVFILCKNHYIIPLILRIIEFPDFSNNYGFIVAFGINKSMIRFDLMHLLFDKNKKLISVSSNCKAHLRLTNKKIKEKDMFINDIIPDLYKTEEGKYATLNYNEITMKCIWIKLISKTKLFMGYYVKLKLINEPLPVTNYNNDLINPKFQFKFCHRSNAFIGSINNDGNEKYSSYEKSMFSCKE